MTPQIWSETYVGNTTDVCYDNPTYDVEGVDENGFLSVRVVGSDEKAEVKRFPMAKVENTCYGSIGHSICVVSKYYRSFHLCAKHYDSATLWLRGGCFELHDQEAHTWNDRRTYRFFECSVTTAVAFGTVFG